MEPRPTEPGAGLLNRSGPNWRISRLSIRRFLLRGGLVMAAAGMNARALLAEGWTKSMSTSTSTSRVQSRSRRGVVERLSVCGRRDGPPLAPPSKGGKLRATFAPGCLRSLFCEFSTGQPGAYAGSNPGLTPPGYMMSPLRGSGTRGLRGLEPGADAAGLYDVASSRLGNPGHTRARTRGLRRRAV